MRILALIFLVATAQACFAQVENEVKKLSDEIKELKKIVQDNASAKSSNVGKLRLVSTKIKPFELNEDGEEKESSAEQLEIDSVVVISKDGSIYNLQVICDDVVFTNKRAPISFGKRINGKEKIHSSKDDTYLRIGDFLQWIELKPFIPDDTTLVLTSEDSEKFIAKGVGINSIFDLRLYTDALGTFGDEANGLIQTEGRFRHIIHRSNFPNRGLYAFPYFKINVSLSKFDSKVAGVDSVGLTRSSLYQRSWLNAEAAVTLLSSWLPKKSYNTWFIDIGAGISLSKLKKSQDSLTVTSPYIYLETGFDFRVFDNVGATVSTRVIGHYSPYITFDEQGGNRIFVKPVIDVFWNPAGNVASRIFFRASYVLDVDEKGESFSQVQLGYSLKLTSLFK